MTSSREARESYIRSKLSVLLPSQIRSLRIRRGIKQSELGVAAGMKQARVSAMEKLGDAKFSIETLIRLAAAFRVGLEVRFVSFGEMLAWENGYQPDQFDVAALENDKDFVRPTDRDNTGGIGEGITAEIIGRDNSSNFSRLSCSGEPFINNSVDRTERFPQKDQEGSSAGAAA
jgi:transcriptional regulator with XRE-family HTH domain